MVCSEDNLRLTGVVTWLGFADACGARDEHVMPIVDPLTGGQAEHQRLIQPAWVAIVDILDTGALPQLRLVQAGLQPAVLPGGDLPIDQQAQAFFETSTSVISGICICS